MKTCSITLAILIIVSPVQLALGMAEEPDWRYEFAKDYYVQDRVSKKVPLGPGPYVILDEPPPQAIHLGYIDTLKEAVELWENGQPLPLVERKFVEAVVEAKSFMPDDDSPAKGYADFLFAQGRYREMRDVIGNAYARQLALVQAPSLVEAIKAKGQLRWELGAYMSAAEAFTGHGTPAVRNYLISSVADQIDFALTDRWESIRETGMEAKFLATLNLGMRSSRNLQYLQACVRLKPKNAVATFKLGTKLLEVGKYEAAANQFFVAKTYAKGNLKDFATSRWYTCTQLMKSKKRRP